MRRRDFTISLGVAAAAAPRRAFVTGLVAAGLGITALWPLAAQAQQPARAPAMPVVGVLNMQTEASETAQLAGIRAGLREAGFVEGRNLALELRFAQGRN